jgi:Rrf2 family cysteine metabolism transcriptional repressor
MQLNESTGYALNIMVYLAQHHRTVSSVELSDHIRVSARYLVQIAGKLRDGGLLGTHMGMSGGYYLLKEASSISAYDIITLLEGDLFITESLSNENSGKTRLHDTLDLLKSYVETYLRSMTLDKLTHMSVKDWHSKFADVVELQIISLRKQNSEIAF